MVVWLTWPDLTLHKFLFYLLTRGFEPDHHSLPFWSSHFYKLTLKARFLMIVFRSNAFFVPTNFVQIYFVRTKVVRTKVATHSCYLLSLCSSVCVCVFSSSLSLCHFHSSYGFATSFSFFSVFVSLGLFQCFSVFLLCHWFYLSLSLHISEFIVIFCIFYFFYSLVMSYTSHSITQSLNSFLLHFLISDSLSICKTF
jgi:hypothetical protein